jgi:hypothetical protein
MRCAILPVAMLLAAPDISGRRLLSAWKDQEPSTRMLAEVIAGAFASGLSRSRSLSGKPVFSPPSGLKGGEAMSAFERFLADHPDMAERPYGDALASSLSQEFPCSAL